MNKLIISAAIAAAFAMNAQAASNGVINFKGKIVDQTCDVLIDGQASPATVTLPTVSTSTLVNQGDVTGQTNFNIELSNCTAAGAVFAYFENGSTVDATTKRLKNTLTGATAADKVQLQLIDGTNGNPIQTGNTNQITATSKVTIDSSMAAVLPYAVEYYSLGGTTAGDVESSVSFTIHYQ